jgi:hypothetical protein
MDGTIGHYVAILSSVQQDVPCIITIVNMLSLRGFVDLWRKLGGEFCFNVDILYKVKPVILKMNLGHCTNC